jgi:hypothetical protein
LAHLHASCRDRPNALLQVELFPSCPDHFLGARQGEPQKPNRSLGWEVPRVFVEGPEERRNLARPQGLLVPGRRQLHRLAKRIAKVCVSAHGGDTQGRDRRESLSGDHRHLGSAFCNAGNYLVRVGGIDLFQRKRTDLREDILL